MAESRLTSGDFTEADDPVALFHEWLEERRGRADRSRCLALATADGDGRPDARMVLLKTFDGRGFVFYTNSRARRARELLAIAEAAMLFHWNPCVGRFACEARRADWRRRCRRLFCPRVPVVAASAPGRPTSRARSIAGRLEGRERESTRATRATRCRGRHLGGLSGLPSVIEFWQDGRFRLHDRIMFFRENETDDWQKLRLYP